MSIQGNYTNIGKDMLQALHHAAQDGQVDASELEALNQAANADGHLSSGEATLLNHLQNDENAVHNLQWADFDPADLAFGQANIHINDQQQVVFDSADLLRQRGDAAVQENLSSLDLEQQLETLGLSRHDIAGPHFFDQMSSELETQRTGLENLLQQAQELTPPNPEQVQRLEKALELNALLTDYQDELAGVIGGSQGRNEDEVALVREALAPLQQFLTENGPDVLGESNHSYAQTLLDQHRQTINDFEQNHIGDWRGSLAQHMMQAESTEVPETIGPEMDAVDSMLSQQDLNTLRMHAAEIPNEIQTRLQSHFAPYLDDASEALRQYLNNPETLAAEDRANVRQEIQDIFSDHPELADAVGQEIGSLSGEFASLRERLGQQLERAQAHGQGEFVEQIEALQADLTRTENQLVNHWLNRQSPIVQALAKERDDLPEEADSAMTWMAESQNRYAQSILQNPGVREQLAGAFDNGLAEDSARAMRNKIADATEEYGEAVDTVPMMLVSDETGETSNFNAYIFYDQDEGEYRVLNPIDRKYYTGETMQEALAELGENSRMLEGQLHFHDGEAMQQFDVDAPRDTSTLDYIATGLVIAGAVAMTVAPEPASTAAGLSILATVGTASVGAGSAYFIGKGSLEMADLYRHGNLGMNRDTMMASLDLASGLLGVLGAAGQAGRTAAAGASTRLGASAGKEAIEEVLQQSLARMAPLGSSQALLGAELGLGAVELGVAAEQIYTISQDDSLSYEEKQEAIATAIMFAAAPLAIAPVIARNIQRDGASSAGGAESPSTVNPGAQEAAPIPASEAQRTHVVFEQQIQQMENALRNETNPNVREVGEASALQTLDQWEAYYQQDGIPPTLAEEGLARIHEARGRLGAERAGATQSETPPPPEEPSITEDWQAAEEYYSQPGMDPRLAEEALAQIPVGRRHDATRIGLTDAEQQTMDNFRVSAMEAAKRTRQQGIERRQTEPELQQGIDFPTRNFWREIRDGNKALAMANGQIDGQSINYQSVSGRTHVEGLVDASPNPQLPYERVGHNLRDADAEFKILEEILANSTRESTGEITLMIDRPSCTSCNRAIEQFMSLRPNIELNIVQGQAIER